LIILNAGAIVKSNNRKINPQRLFSILLGLVILFFLVYSKTKLILKKIK